MHDIKHLQRLHSKRFKYLHYVFLLCIFMLVLSVFVSRSQAFTWSLDTIHQIAIYTLDDKEKLSIAPGDIHWNLDAETITQFVASIDWDTAYSCSDWGGATIAVIYVNFGDGTITPYDYTPPYISRRGMYGICRDVNDFGDELIQIHGQ